MMARLAVPFVAATLCLCITGAARAADVWQQNIAMLVTTDGKPEGAAEVYDSPDFQQILLLMEGRPQAYVLNIADGAVYGCPRDSVRTDAEGNASLGIFKMDFVSDLAKKDATMSFTVMDQSIALAPLPPLIGSTTLGNLVSLKPAYARAAQAYRPDPAKIAILKSVSEDTEIRIYFGTWCLLCKKLVPPVIRTIGAAANPNIHASYIGVDEDLKSPAAEIEQYHVTKTPTVIVLRNGVELGRIEEKAGTTIEGDLVSILASKH
jgi:thiol-disulfide isomerase/thioredoxin